MKITSAEIIALAVSPEKYPPAGPPEIAFAGRSNVGKSSLLNALAVRKRLAYTSGSPGKTQTINFYAINGDALRFVDLPGYGFARAPRRVSEKWGAMIEGYLKNREQLKVVALLVDIRHEPTADDIQLYEFLKYYGLSGLIVATKADKISRNAVSSKIKSIKELLKAGADDKVYPVSSLKRTGADELLEEIERICRKNTNCRA
ncbi:MAG: ribosome biogenesis GTP-binding protein YihA/YsxC [Clostridiales Family XIII bacterium]|jgi:GTP-binding protein|nr:ribosome biogenesis GTP-binding protein YihA/YsxC [Clostridiales Family XIII bacterium]